MTVQTALPPLGPAGDTLAVGTPLGQRVRDAVTDLVIPMSPKIFRIFREGSLLS